MKTVKRRVFVEDVIVFDRDLGFGMSLDCITAEQKRFSLGMSFDSCAKSRSVMGRNWRLIERMLAAANRPVEYGPEFDDKTTAARIRHCYFWFKIDVYRDGAWLRDVRPCDPFEIVEPDPDAVFDMVAS